MVTPNLLMVIEKHYGSFVSTIDSLESEAHSEIAQTNDVEYENNPDKCREYRRRMNNAAKLLHEQRIALLKENEQCDEFTRTTKRMASIEKLYKDEAKRFERIIEADNAEQLHKRNVVLNAMYKKCKVPNVLFEEVKDEIGDKWYNVDADDSKIQTEITDFCDKITKKCIEWDASIMALPKDVGGIRQAINAAGGEVLQMKVAAF